MYDNIQLIYYSHERAEEQKKTGVLNEVFLTIKSDKQIRQEEVKAQSYLWCGRSCRFDIIP